MTRLAGTVIGKATYQAGVKAIKAAVMSAVVTTGGSGGSEASA
jgi:hypothetical protein